MTDTPTQDEQRRTVATWLRANRWTAEHLNAAMRAHPGISSVPAGTTLRRWLAGETSLKRGPLGCMANFIARYPEPGDARAFIDGLGDRFREKLARRDEQILARKLDVERQREKWRRDNLAREWAPKPRERGPLDGLDKETVQALRGY